MGVEGFFSIKGLACCAAFADLEGFRSWELATFLVVALRGAILEESPETAESVNKEF